MYKKQQPNGKWKFFEKYQDKQDKWKQVSVTKNSGGREAQSQARTELELKIAEKLSEEKEAEEAPKTINECYAESRKIRQAELAESTYLSETYGLKDFIKKFGQREIISIEPKEMQEYLFSNKYSNTTRHTIALRIGHIFQYAYSMGFTHENIMNRIILPKQKKSAESLAKWKEKFFTMDEMRKFLKSWRSHAVEKDDFKRADFVEFLFLTGLRIGEASGLQWSHVDILKRVIYIQFSWNCNLKKLGPTKNPQSVRYVTLNDRCLEILENFRKDKYGSKFVFVKSNGVQIRNADINTYLKIEGARANLFGKNYKQFSAHMLRHSHITMLAFLGAPQKAVMERVGHMDARITNGVYTHVLPENRQDLQLKLENLNL
ncbi:MAG: site-specific integrase [Lactococcus lactis]|uniref:Integrase n=4 Tax=Streptococcaceae TaxID=1300 RepID=T0WLR9_LACLC|nr:site-specific integrase [Lactococcus cremoris]EQC94139.1 integrase [Lactococcus cremoris subsp. cremoris TIFN3]MDU1524839.1 site-specific integrase [Lactococcus lactis]AEU41192.1 Integrase [Lactococcus cremoris subsp. cremoris A76]MCT4399311.1 site-specific integrase [Lactococcus cremoris]MCT4427961.1 site-specific integrase [Lactococcus cremoris]